VSSDPNEFKKSRAKQALKARFSALAQLNDPTAPRMEPRGNSRAENGNDLDTKAGQHALLLAITTRYPASATSDADTLRTAESNPAQIPHAPEFRLHWPGQHVTRTPRGREFPAQRPENDRHRLWRRIHRHSRPGQKAGNRTDIEDAAARRIN